MIDLLVLALTHMSATSKGVVLQMCHVVPGRFILNVELAPFVSHIPFL